MIWIGGVWRNFFAATDLAPRVFGTLFWVFTFLSCGATYYIAKQFAHQPRQVESSIAWLLSFAFVGFFARYGTVMEVRRLHWKRALLGGLTIVYCVGVIYLGIVCSTMVRGGH